VPIKILADQFPGIAWQIEGPRRYSRKAVHMQTLCFGDKNVSLASAPGNNTNTLLQSELYVSISTGFHH